MYLARGRDGSMWIAICLLRNLFCNTHPCMYMHTRRHQSCILSSPVQTSMQAWWCSLQLHNAWVLIVSWISANMVQVQPSLWYCLPMNVSCNGLNPTSWLTQLTHSCLASSLLPHSCGMKRRKNNKKLESQDKGPATVMGKRQTWGNKSNLM